MFEVKLINLATQKIFKKTFTSPYFMNKFLNKCKYSKKVQVLSYGPIY